jgi:hypothetical protein
MPRIVQGVKMKITAEMLDKPNQMDISLVLEYYGAKFPKGSKPTATKLFNMHCLGSQHKNGDKLYTF